MVKLRAVRGGQFLLFAPGRPFAGKYIGRPLILVRAGIRPVCANQGHIVVQGHRKSELIPGRAVPGLQLRPFAPPIAFAREYVSRSLVNVAVNVRVQRSDQQGVAIQGQRAAEQVKGRAVPGRQLLPFTPGGAVRAGRAAKYVHRPLVNAAGAVRPVRADRQGFPIHRHRQSQRVAGRAVGRGQRPRLHEVAPVRRCRRLVIIG